MVVWTYGDDSAKSGMSRYEFTNVSYGTLFIFLCVHLRYFRCALGKAGPPCTPCILASRTHDGSDSRTYDKKEISRSNYANRS